MASYAFDCVTTWLRHAGTIPYNTSSQSLYFFIHKKYSFKETLAYGSLAFGKEKLASYMFK